MKKMYTFIAILVLILAYAFMTTGKKQTVEKPQENPITKENLPVVGILQLTSHPALDAIHQGILDGLKEAGYEDGKNITIDFQNAQGDQSNMKSMSEQFVSKDAAAMIGIATPSAQALANASSDIPIILGAVTDPEGAGLVESNEKPGGNVTGVSDLTPIDEQMELLKTLLPEAKTVGILYASSEDNSKGQAEEAAKIAEQKGLKTVTMTVSNTNDVAQVVASLASKVDAIYVPADNTIASAMNTLVEATDQAGIPVIPAAETMVDEGGLATVGLDQYQLGVLTGKMTARILSGEAEPATMPIEYLSKGSIKLNQEKAKQLGITIPESVSSQIKAKGGEE